MVFKIATFNVHNPNLAMIDNIVKIIRDFEIDIIFLQEITRKPIEYLAKKLRWNYAWLEGQYIGNGFVTMCNIVDKQEIPLLIDIVTEKRSALKIVVESGLGKLTLLGTHLDHRREPTRMKQLEYLFTQVDTKTVDFFLGDFNSLRKEDYSNEELVRINNERRLSNWEVAHFDVVDRIMSAGFKINKYLNYTCRFKTRIDYIFHNPKWKIKQNSIINTIKYEVSDHQLVISTLDEK